MRIIGVRHRVKRTTQGEARPTQVVVQSGDNILSYDLATETDELDFMLGRFPTGFRSANEEDDLKNFLERQVKWKKLKSEEEASEHPRNLVRHEKKDWFRATHVPDAFDGLTSGDRVVMVLGGSGDRFAFALSKRGEQIGASVHRLPSFLLNEKRGERSKDEDTLTLIELFQSNPEIFYRIEARDRDLIQLKEAFYGRVEAQRARIGCEQRLGSRVIGKIFLSEDGLYPNGLIEDEADAEKANDLILKGLNDEEKRRDKDLKRAVRKLDVWREIFVDIEGIGETIAAGVVVAVGDIRRFKTAPKLKKFLGVHVDALGRFPRKRVGVVANWHPKGRQALYLLAQQFLYRPDSVWGKKLREYKAKLREKHPVVECSVCQVPFDECKKANGTLEIVDAMQDVALTPRKHTKRYTDGHIHKMAIWKTLTKFVEALHRDWWNLEKRSEGLPNSKESAA